MKLSQNIRYKIKTASIVEKLIGINVAVFLFFFILKTVAFLFNYNSGFIMQWFVFPKELSEFITKPWSLVTYAFLHAGLWHIVSNMLILYFSGIYALHYFSPKKLLNFYFLGAICGALLYMLSYNLFPVFQGMGRSYLLGASAAVMAILVGVATHVPNLKVRLILIGSIKLWWIAAFLVVLDIVQIPISNPGGHLAHLGGAAFGYVYAKQLGKGNDIAHFFGRLQDWVVSLFSASGVQRKGNLKTVYKKKKASKAAFRTGMENKKERQQKIDLILDKIGKSGYDSLTKQEKDYLFNAGKDNS